MAGKMKTMDGNKAAAYVSYAFTDCAAIFPITPSSPMAEHIDEWSAQGQKNLFGQTVKVVEMQSEAGAAGAMHGSLSAGALTTTYTASQGLLLMIPNMYKMAGELLPGVMHVSARTLASHALSIFGDHSDVMACRQTGFAMLASSSVQEVMDLAGVAHLAAIKSRVPFMHFFDGFRTSHEMQKIEVVDYEDLAGLLDADAVRAFRSRGLNPQNPVVKGTAQNPDIFFQAREACNPYYGRVPEIVTSYMKEITRITGREYLPFRYYGAPDAEYVIVAMGSVCDVVEESISYLAGEKVGLVKVHLYRPFASDYFLRVLPPTVRRIAVLDRTKEPGSLGEPLYEDVRAALYDAPQRPAVVGGRYGLGSKDVTPDDVMAVFTNLKDTEPKSMFTLGITDDVTQLSLERRGNVDTTPEGTIQCKFFGLGSDGTVGANKQAVEIIGDNTNLYTQAYFAYDSKKSGGITISHLRFGTKPIKCPYLINNADFISCSNQSYVHSLDLLAGLKDGGTFLLNCTWSPETLDANLPAAIKRYLAEHHINFYIINAAQTAKEIGLGNRTNMIMQAAFFELARVIPLEEATNHLKESIRKAYSRKGEEVVKMNYAAVDKGVSELVRVEVPAAWAAATDPEPAVEKDVPAFVRDLLRPMNRQEGDKLPVSAFREAADGVFPVGTSRYEKRGVANFIPRWIAENCIQCNQCSLVCPHAAIRPVLLTEAEAAAAPPAFTAQPAIGKQLAGLSFRMQVSPLDCMGCGSCVNTCPAKTKALELQPLESQAGQAANWDYAQAVGPKDGAWDLFTVKGSQFAQPLLEFSGACQGCGETPYAKLVTQLFGDRMIISNATGCSSIWGASAPSTPYCTNGKGRGPAWANSLFEDNAEHGYGMAFAVGQIRNRLAGLVKGALSLAIPAELQEAFRDWLAGKDDAAASRAAADRILPLLETGQHRIIDEIAAAGNFLAKPSFWIFGGDGWAYDIGYGGLDHVLASGENVNVLVFDTEVYSNTGGQSSKSTPAAAIAKFAASGKRTRKKDLGLMTMSYGYVYVAQIAMGADRNQTIKALKEAEAYEGPSLIIAYAPCINHGLKSGMGRAQAEMDRAVKAGYWHLYRFNPDAAKEGKNPFSLDSKEPTASFQDFLEGEVRYASLKQLFPSQAGVLFEKAEQDARQRYEKYLELARGC